MQNLYQVPHVVAYAFNHVMLDRRNDGGIARTLNAALNEKNELAGFVITGWGPADNGGVQNESVYYFTETMRAALAALDSSEPLSSTASKSEGQK